MISIECRAYDQLIKHNSQEAIGLVHFEVRKCFLFVKSFSYFILNLDLFTSREKKELF